jgi:ABC-type uncharacterized transport system ATPase subunit
MEGRARTRRHGSIHRSCRITSVAAGRCFAAPDFYEKHGSDWQTLEADLKAKREEVARLYSRWQQLEAIRVAAP